VSPTPSISPRTEAEQIVLLTRELEWSRLKIQSLEQRLRLELIAKYGPKSEKLNDAQLQLLELEPGVSTAEVAAESQREPLPSASPVTAKNRKAGKHPGRKQLPAWLPRVEQVIVCTPEQCVCGSCGQDTVVIGYEQSEQLDVEPASYFVLVTKREKRACKGCFEGVSAAPLPERIIDKGLVSDRVVIDTLVSGEQVSLQRKPFCTRKSICLSQAPESSGRPCETRRKASPLFSTSLCCPRL
jgi:transposase